MKKFSIARFKVQIQTEGKAQRFPIYSIPSDMQRSQSFSFEWGRFLREKKGLEKLKRKVLKEAGHRLCVLKNTEEAGRSLWFNYPSPGRKKVRSVDSGISDQDLRWRRSWPRETVSTLFTRAESHMGEPSQAWRPWVTTRVSTYLSWSFVPGIYNYLCFVALLPVDTLPLIASSTKHHLGPFNRRGPLGLRSLRILTWSAPCG